MYLLLKKLWEYLISPVASSLLFSKKYTLLQKIVFFKSAHPSVFISGKEALAMYV
jgi:hypothetical protein